MRRGERGLTLAQRAARRAVAMEIGDKVLAHRKQHGNSALLVPVEDFARWCTVFGIELQPGASDSFRELLIEPSTLAVRKPLERPNIMEARIRALADSYSEISKYG